MIASPVAQLKEVVAILLLASLLLSSLTPYWHYQCETPEFHHRTSCSGSHEMDKHSKRMTRHRTEEKKLSDQPYYVSSPNSMAECHLCLTLNVIQPLDLRNSSPSFEAITYILEDCRWKSHRYKPTHVKNSNLARDGPAFS